MAITVNHQTNDISATSGSLTIDGAAVGGGGGVLEVISHQVTTETVTEVAISSIPSIYRSYKLIMNYALAARASSLPSLNFFDGTTQLTGFTLYRSAAGNQSNQTGQSDVHMVRDFSMTNFVTEVNIFGLGQDNTSLVISGQSYSNDVANAVCEFGALRSGAVGTAVDKIVVKALFSNIPAGAVITLYGLKGI